jgi:MFS family permease
MDTEKGEASAGSADVAASDTSVSQVLTIDPKREAKLLRKLDLSIAPIVLVIFLAAYLDRANVGNAASAGMTEDIGMSSSELGSKHSFSPRFTMHSRHLTDYHTSDAVTLFYVTYVAFEVPCSLVLKKFHPRRMIPALIFCWSVVLIGTGFMKNVGQLYASRLLLGVFESGLFPCLALYLSSWYKPREQALRISYLFVSAALSGSFGGLFAYALLKMDGIAGLEGWRWLFIIEGCASVLVAIVAYFVLADDFESASFLNEEDKSLMRIRAEINARYHGDQEFNWADVKRAVLDPKLYISSWNQFMADICSFGLSSFLPLIIKSFGFDVVTTQLLTIPVFFFASFTYVVISWSSDRWGKRAFFMMPACLVTAVGYALYLGAHQRGVLYLATFLIAPGVYIIVVSLPISNIRSFSPASNISQGLNVSWLLNSHAPYYKRAMAIGMNQSIGNSAGVVVSHIFYLHGFEH